MSEINATKDPAGACPLCGSAARPGGLYNCGTRWIASNRSYSTSLLCDKWRLVDLLERLVDASYYDDKNGVGDVIISRHVWADVMKEVCESHE